MLALLPSATDWQLDRLDLAAYLARVGHDGPVAADAATLRALHRAHADKVPFENLDILLGRGVDLDLDAVQNKLVRRPRGGYCFEHNHLFAAVLERLGFEVTRHLGRVNPSNPRAARTHMVLRVVADGEPWLADVGFGACLLEPIPLRDGEVRQGGWTYRLQDDGRGWLLSEPGRPDPGDLYEFTLEAQRPVDFAVASHYTATHPRSPFTQRVVALRTEPEVRHALRGTTLTTTWPDSTSREREVPAREMPAVLLDVFGIGLSPAEARRLQGRPAAEAA